MTCANYLSMVDQSWCLPKLKTVLLYDFSSVNENFLLSLLNPDLYCWSNVQHIFSLHKRREALCYIAATAAWLNCLGIHGASKEPTWKHSLILIRHNPLSWLSKNLKTSKIEKTYTKLENSRLYATESGHVNYWKVKQISQPLAQAYYVLTFYQNPIFLKDQNMK